MECAVIRHTVHYLVLYFIIAPMKRKDQISLMIAFTNQQRYETVFSEKIKIYRNAMTKCSLQYFRLMDYDMYLFPFYFVLIGVPE